MCNPNDQSVNPPPLLEMWEIGFATPLRIDAPAHRPPTAAYAPRAIYTFAGGRLYNRPVHIRNNDVYAYCYEQAGRDNSRLLYAV